MTPFLFSEIVGQGLAKRILKKAVSEGRVPHAYLFFGIPGVGKTSMARALALALNCERVERGEGCGECPACKRMKSGNSPEFGMIQPEGQNIRIHQIRELNRQLAFAPALGRYRVCVLQQAESMTLEAANAFLKTLEEPPPRNVFVLSGTESQDLLPTILSRCQKIPFHPAPAEEVANALELHRGLDREKASILGRLSGGSLGRAFKMSDGGYLEKRQEWLFHLMGLPKLSSREVLALVQEVTGGEARATLDSPGSEEPGLLDMLGLWQSWYRDLALLSVNGDPQFLTNTDFSRKLKGLSVNFTTEALTDSIFRIGSAQRDLRRNRNPSLVLTHLLFNLKRVY
jgi:DNA polymerase-3 subunit delta'